MAFLDRVKDNIIEFLRPGTQQESGELKTLRQLYDNPMAGNLRPNQWYQLVNTSGKLLGYSYVCNDLCEFQLPHPNEWLRDYECPQCRAKFSLYKQAGIVDAKGNFKVPASEIEKILSKLPVRPRMDARTPNFVDPGSVNGEGDIGYEAFTPTGLEWR